MFRMSFYKLIDGKNFVGVATDDNFLTFQKKHNILLACDVDKAQYIQYYDKFYRDNWMTPTTTTFIPYTTVSVIEIKEDEYNTLNTAAENGEEIVVEEEPEEIYDEVYVDVVEEITIDYLKNQKIKEINKLCNQIITNGFDVTLSDGENHHFSLTTQDQLNLTTLSAMAASGTENIPYHADGEPCKFFSVKDVQTIVQAAMDFKTFHITYHNALKNYIDSLVLMDDIEKVSYGMEIPEEYQSEVLKIILQKGRV